MSTDLTFIASHPCSLCEAEGRKVYAALFGGEPPPLLLARFATAAKILNSTASQTEVDQSTRALLASSDPEALELVARLTRRLPLLTRKFRLMAYLAETLPENQVYFVNSRSGLLRGLANIAGAVLRTAWKLPIGLWQLRRVPRE
ncbi:MAG: hypothetical protein N2204_08600 [Anaerolineae bacterium]|nr:hypothetical protein [Anaerolineae bacterium]